MEKDNIITEESEFKKNAIRIIKGSIFVRKYNVISYTGNHRNKYSNR